MNRFKKNKIYLDATTVAEQLRQARQSKNLKLKEIAAKLNINEKYLASLEKGQYDQLPSGVYGKNFLREYALFLGLNYQQLLKNYEEEIALLDPKKQKEIFSRKVIAGRHFWAIPKILKNIIILLIISVCFVYLGYRVNKIIAPPLLIVANPGVDLITEQNSILVTGRTEAEANLTINGEMVLSDKNGNFFKLINLKSGINFITVTTSKRYSRSQTITRQVLLKP